MQSRSRAATPKGQKNKLNKDKSRDRSRSRSPMGVVDTVDNEEKMRFQKITEKASSALPVACGVIDHLFKKVNDDQVTKRIRKEAVPKTALTTVDMSHVTAHMQNILPDRRKDDCRIRQDLSQDFSHLPRPLDSLQYGNDGDDMDTAEPGVPIPDLYSQVMMHRTRKIVYVAPDYQVKKGKKRKNKKEVVNHIPNFHRTLGLAQSSTVAGFDIQDNSQSFRLGTGENSIDNHSEQSYHQVFKKPGKPVPLPVPEEDYITKIHAQDGLTDKDINKAKEKLARRQKLGSKKRVKSLFKKVAKDLGGKVDRVVQGYATEQLKAGKITTGHDGKKIEIMPPNANNFPTIINSEIQQEICESVPGNQSMYTRFAMALVKKLRKYLDHQIAEDELKNDKQKQTLLNMKSTKGQTNSLVQRFANDFKKGDDSMNQAMDLTIKPRKNVTYTFRNRVQIGGEDSVDTLTVSSANHTATAKVSRQNTRTFKTENQETMDRTKETKGETTKYNTGAADSDSNIWTKRNSSQLRMLGDTNLDGTYEGATLDSVPEDIQHDETGMKIKVEGSLHEGDIAEAGKPSDVAIFHDFDQKSDAQKSHVVVQLFDTEHTIRSATSHGQRTVNRNRTHTNVNLTSQVLNHESSKDVSHQPVINQPMFKRTTITQKGAVSAMDMINLRSRPQTMIQQHDELKNSFSRVTINNRHDFKGILLSPKSRFFDAKKQLPSFTGKGTEKSALQVVIPQTPDYYKVRKPSMYTAMSTKSTAAPRFGSINAGNMTPDAASRPNTANLHSRRHYSRNSGGPGAERFASVTHKEQPHLLVEVRQGTGARREVDKEALGARFNRGKTHNIDFETLQVPAARETFFNRRAITGAQGRKRPEFRGRLKSALQTPLGGTTQHPSRAELFNKSPKRASTRFGHQ